MKNLEQNGIQPIEVNELATYSGGGIIEWAYEVYKTVTDWLDAV